MQAGDMCTKIIAYNVDQMSTGVVKPSSEAETTYPEEAAWRRWYLKALEAPHRYEQSCGNIIRKLKCPVKDEMMMQRKTAGEPLLCSRFVLNDEMGHEGVAE